MRARVVGLRDPDPELVRSWHDLVGAALEPNPFYEPEPVLAAAELLQDGDRAGLLVVQDGAELVLAVPVLRRQRFRQVPVPALVSWQYPHCFSGVPLVRAGREHEAWAEVLDEGKHLSSECWLVLPWLSLQAPVAVALQDVLAARRVRATALDVFGRPVLRRRADCTYLDGRMSSRHRKSLRRLRRRLEEQLGGDLELVDLAASGDVAAGVEEMLRVEATGWKGRSGTAIASRSGDADWFRRFALAMAEQGRLQLWVLRAGDRVAAAQVNVLSGGTAFHFKIAYDADLARFSPGLQLELAMVEEFHRDLRLSAVDSCGNYDIKVSAQLYPDRDVVGTLVVPMRGRLGQAAAGTASLATRVRAARLAAKARAERAEVPA